MKAAVIVGTRPELIKMAVLIKVLKSLDPHHLFIHSGQHYDYSMDGAVLDTFHLQQPDYHLKVGSGSHASTTAKILTGVEEIIQREKIDLVIVHGDTNTTLGGTLAAAKLNVKIAHVEAGLRSYDRSMPEEINRVLVDHIAQYLFTPTQQAGENLAKEGIVNGVYQTGQTIVDAVHFIKSHVQSTKLLQAFNLQPKSYFFVTVHRQENTDNPLRLSSIVNALDRVAKEGPEKVVLSLHPRTKQKLIENNLYERLKTNEAIILIDPPTNFVNALLLQRDAKGILTDSGGIQEEACIIGTPCITLRLNTERPETVECGANQLAGFETQSILQCVESIRTNQANWKHPYGNHGVSQKILDILFS
ncbi:non-hydrolyzing UDP-N-acetylglucosamine 2-epimerase [Halalkalibacterium halodurans]|uniref:non-hydrolyzing UDP-N-acetylglucosamine 2-epimerase n=1 Tax=Halalkalibacterium halodurans TaxID=86665 RepID=UPI002AA9D81F|nr:UDP-N-acetylglucosamine 2-epimerase (non-hydrolyzing) [Halalkalibacterium halodurans]MDY7223908.1 UDP-N-acetylglucosamine 2-epimerase (non-hydrolyzing) [Halalkalibacterium halodurans]MDY7243129.1 UDP-N-acetylglucosamine 2-epimerase (non-hydrolyzing) [Halalkalibacterium halodurans]